MSWLVGWVCPSNLTPEDLNHFFSKVEKVIENRGVGDAITLVKGTRVSFLKALENDPDLEKKRALRGLLTRVLGSPCARKVLQDGPKNLRFILTVLSTTRGFLLPVSLETSSITDPYSGEENPEVGRYVKGFWRKLGGRRKTGWADLKVRWKRFHFTTKAGPNGHALMSAVTDLFALPDGLIESVGKVGGKEILRNIEVLQENRETLRRTKMYFPEKTRIRKVSGIQDSEGKTRPVAIFDYWSQTVLRPLHSFLFRILKKIPQDCTFDQGSFRDRIRTWENPMFYSVDLSNATDRFPISVIKKVLSGAFSEEYVSHWENIMVGYPFTLNKGGEVSYQVGNPMGAYSSWASFALAHHYVVYECCVELRIPWEKAPYCLLGDDIVLGSKELGEAYLRKISSIGVGVSSDKTHKSERMIEFAKRLFIDGREVTPFRLSSVTNNWRKYPLLVSALSGEWRKGFAFTGKGIPHAVSGFYQSLGKPRRFTAGIFKKADLCEAGTAVLSGRVAPHYFVNKVAWDSHLLSEEVQVYEDVGDHIFRSACFSLFLEAQGSAQEGAIGTKAVEVVTSIVEDDSVADLEALITAVPFLQINRLIGEVFVAMGEEEMKMIESDDEGFWPFVTSLAVPVSDEVFAERRYDTLHRISSALRNHVKEAISNHIGSYQLHEWTTPREEYPLGPISSPPRRGVFKEKGVGIAQALDRIPLTEEGEMGFLTWLGLRGEP